MQTIEYKTLDKSKWGDGPWQNEPDKRQWMDETTNLPCMIRRGPSGAWCGYVGVNAAHPWFEQCYSDDNIEDKVEVHCGLTFAGKCIKEGNQETGICHLVEEGEDDNIWWFGFDCAHGFDYMPAFRAEVLDMQNHIKQQDNYKETLDAFNHVFRYEEGGQSYKDIHYVTTQTLKLAQQLKTEALK